MILSSASQTDGLSTPPRLGRVGGHPGLPHTRLHDGRHTAGTLLIGQDVHLRVVQEILGHTDIRVTQKYTHVSSATARDAADRIGAALWPETP